MRNVTFDSTSFSEQLGLYDFFNVVLAGATFICGICIINQEINNYIWSDISFQKGLGLILAIYILGMILQEIGSVVDSKIFRIYKGMNRSILKGNVNDSYETEIKKNMIKNPIVLERYRKTADKLLKEYPFHEDNQRFENDNVNGYVFSVYQYYVSVHGKDKKVEKLRALFAMAKTLVACFFVLAIIALLSIFTNAKSYINICDVIGLSYLECTECASKVMYCILFAFIGGFFAFRARRVMKNFLLILLGTYDAIVRSDEREKSEVDSNTKKAKNSKNKLNK